MSTDLRNSLVAWLSVAALVAFFVLSLSLLKQVEVPEWLLPLGVLLSGIALISNIVDLLRRRKTGGSK